MDVVLLMRGIVFCIEFKAGKKDATQEDLEQVLDYALDLKNFHLYSADKPIAPILVPTQYPRATETVRTSAYDDGILNPSITGASSLQEIIEKILSVASTDWNPESWGKQWTISPYTPTPTIIEAARTLYENHSVEDITRHEADKVFTDATIDYLLQVIRTSKERGEKSICFVTGVPGAGKTLVGLDVAIKQSYKDGEKTRRTAPYICLVTVLSLLS